LHRKRSWSWDVLKRRLRDHVAVRGFLIRIAEEAEAQPEVKKPAAVAPRDGARRVESAVLLSIGARSGPQIGI
jgi:hypothetical protein